MIYDRKQPLNCRLNEYDRKALMKRYVGFMQDLNFGNTRVPVLMSKLAEVDPVLRHAKGHMRARPGNGMLIFCCVVQCSFSMYVCIYIYRYCFCNVTVRLFCAVAVGVYFNVILDSLLTENEDKLVRTATIRVQGAGYKDINGDYTFSKMRYNAGSYVKPGTFNGQPIEYTLYKCSVQNGSFQWFISIAPEGKELGTNNDIDFYYAQCRVDVVDMLTQALPPNVWALAQNKIDTVPLPPPRVTWLRVGEDGGHLPAPPTTDPPSLRQQRPTNVGSESGRVSQLPLEDINSPQNIIADGFSDSDLDMNAPEEDDDDDDDDDDDVNEIDFDRLNDSTFSNNSNSNSNLNDSTGNSYYGNNYHESV